MEEATPRAPFIGRGRGRGFVTPKNDEDIDTNSINSNTPKGPMTRARARQLNIQVNSLLFESRYDISESWILPHAPYVCLISFAGEDGKRMDDRETEKTCCFQTHTGLTAGQAGQTGAPQLKTSRAVRPPDSPVRPAPPAEGFTGGPTARHAGRTGTTAEFSAELHGRSNRPTRRSDRPTPGLKTNFPKPPTIKGAPPPNSKGTKIRS